MWSKAVLVARIVAVAWAVLVGIALALSAVGMIEVDPELETTGWIISIAIIGVDNLGTMVKRKVNHDNRRFHSDIDEAVLPMLTQLAETEKVRFEHLGGSVYRLKPRRWFSRTPRELHRVRRIRPSNYPTRNGAHWTTATGQVGEAFRVGEMVYMDWHDAGMEWRNYRPRIDAFEELDLEVRGDHSYAEFTAAANRYSEIVAIPLFSPRDDSKVVGVLTIDRLFQPDGTEYTPFLNTQVAQRIYAGPQELIASILKPTGTS